MSKLDIIDRQLNDTRKDVEYKIDKMESRLTSEMKDRLKETVHKNEFDPVKRIVYGMVAVVLMGVGAAVLKLVVYSGAIG